MAVASADVDMEAQYDQVRISEPPTVIAIPPPASMPAVPEANPNTSRAFLLALG